MPTQHLRQSSKIEWSTVSKAAPKSKRIKIEFPVLAARYNQVLHNFKHFTDDTPLMDFFSGGVTHENNRL